MSEQQQMTSFAAFLRSIIHAYRFAKSKWLVLVLSGLVGGILGLAYAWLSKPSYESKLSFSIEEETKGAGGGLLSLASQFGVDVGNLGGIFSGENILELFKSRRIIENSLLSPVAVNGKTMSFADFYLDMSGDKKAFAEDARLKNIQYPLSLPRAQFSVVQDSVLGNMYQSIAETMIGVNKPDKKFNIFYITCTSPNEQFSKLFSERLVEEVVKFYVVTKTKRSRTNVEVLEQRADSIKRAYFDALSGRASIADANVNPLFQTPLVGIQRKQTDITVLASAYGEIVKNLEIAKYTALKETPLIQIIDRPIYPLKKIKKSKRNFLIIGGGVFFFVTLTGLFLRKKVKEALAES
jgi:hypothetical protein